MPLQYQLITLGPSAGQYQRLHDQRLREFFQDLDLDPASSLAVLGAEQRSALNGKCSIVGLWYGGDSPFEGEPEHRAALKSLMDMDMGVVVFPLCGDITRFTQQIPKELQPIGGTQWDEARVTGDVLSVYRAMTSKSLRASITKIPEPPPHVGLSGSRLPSTQ